MKTIIKIHEKAMQVYDLAKMAKIKGDGKGHRSYLEKAYILEREAALKIQAAPDAGAWRFLILRSAGWMALECGYTDEAKMLADLGMASKPSSHAEFELKGLLAEIEKSKINPVIKNGSGSLGLTTVSGVVSFADADRTNIKIKEMNGPNYQTVAVPEEMFQLIVRSYFGEAVEISIKKNGQGHPILQHIRRAA